MVDLMSTLSANYKAVGLTIPVQDRLCGGRCRALSGHLDRKYANNKSFTISISDVAAEKWNRSDQERRH
jgi:hypothetical protein